MKLIMFALAIASTTALAESTVRDGQHDFDFEIGHWNFHLKYLKQRLHNSHEWLEGNGTSVMRPLLGGKANIDEVSVVLPTGPLEGVTFRIYSPESHQWSIYWANRKDGQLGLPPMVGEFKDGRGEFYDQEDFEGRKIYVRFVWSNMTAKSAHFEQAFSADGGKTWETNWISDQTRIQ
ncbi:MAG TPA: hypothetical protein VGG74_19690 [Kofleriaceae bacterium]|jgi:hypothetical protein